jgi:integrase/recombinase XerD
MGLPVHCRWQGGDPPWRAIHLHKYLRRAMSSVPKLGRSKISPHTLRYTKAMHLLPSGVPLVMVKDFLGYVDLKSTEVRAVHVQADLEMKRRAL